MFVQRFLLVAGICIACSACDADPAPEASDGRRIAPAVVSLVPAATDLILGMGAGEHLVAVSNWDPPRAEIAHLPRAGDYRTIDWEQIAAVRPDIMIVQYHADRIPPGLSDRAAASGIRLVNVKINRLDDVFETIDLLGGALDRESDAADAAARLRAQLDSVRSRVAGETPVRTLISRSESPLAVVGGGNFMDDLLTLAGGQNVIPTGENSYPTIDREMLLALDPRVVLHILPGASPQELEQARLFWPTVPQIAAVREGRVYFLTESFLLLPGFSAGRTAEIFASHLHPEAPAEERQ